MVNRQQNRAVGVNLFRSRGVGSTFLKNMNRYYLLLLALFVQYACNEPANPASSARDGRVVDANCETCFALYQSPVPLSELDNIDTVSCFLKEGPPLHISGIVYQRDGKTPAPDVILYFYHTNQAGIYPRRSDEDPQGPPQGSLRGWLRSNQKGEYHIYTSRPAPYPDGNTPAHIHLIVKEPNTEPYWLEDFFFADDPLLHAPGGPSPSPRGGSGVLTPVLQNGVWEATRHIRLGWNVY